MFQRTRLVALTGAAMLAVSWLAASGVATANSAQSSVALLSCDGLAPTIVVAAPGMVTFGVAGMADVIIGTTGADTIHGLDQDDHICGLDGNDNITGGQGNDRIFGQGADDSMRGGPGDDLLNGGPHIEGDRGDGGPGMDACPATEITVNC